MLSVLKHCVSVSVGFICWSAFVLSWNSPVSVWALWEWVYSWVSDRPVCRKRGSPPPSHFELQNTENNKRLRLLLLPCFFWAHLPTSCCHNLPNVRYMASPHTYEKSINYIPIMFLSTHSLLLSAILTLISCCLSYLYLISTFSCTEYM